LKPNILIVDDEVHLARKLEMALRHEYHVISTHQPERALEIFHNGDFDLVISDIQMPKLSGFEILRAVKETNPLIEVILLTGEIPDRAEPTAKTLQRDANNYLLKPVRIRELREAIHSAFKNQRRFLENKRYFQELVQLAYTDSLTGLSNRHHFESQFNLEFERSERYERPLSCVILDIDDFKKINHAFGHRMGDQVLKQIGDLLLQNFRSCDLKCRYGGEEFVLLTPEADKELVITIAEKLRRIVSREIFTFTGSSFRVAGSVGVATYWRKNFKSASDLLRAAELALIKAKHEGKNCVRVYTPLLLQALRSAVPIINHL
jgi:two-component system cell cycle response regulator